LIVSSKLRGPIGRIGPYAVTVFLCLGAIETILFSSFTYSAIFFGCFFIVMGSIEFFRTKLISYLILGLLFGTGTWHSVARFFFSFLSIQTYWLHVIIAAAALALTLPSILRNEKLEANARRLFHLAGEFVHETSHGFTARPYSDDSIYYSRDEIQGFARFLCSKNIVKTFTQEQAVTLIFSMGISPIKEAELDKTSYISFDNKNNMAVFISAYDYKCFKHTLTFDQLCASLGSVFKRFLQYYKQGQESRIIVELKAGGK